MEKKTAKFESVKTPVKPEAKTSVAKEEPVKATKAVETKTIAKQAEEKAVEKVEAAKTEAKAVAEKVGETKKAVEKKAVAKKAAVKKAVAKKEELKPEIYVQFNGQEAVLADVIEKAKKQFADEGHRAGSIKTLQVYLKPEEYAAYYVINQKYAGRVNLF